MCVCVCSTSIRPKNGHYSSIFYCTKILEYSYLMKPIESNRRDYYLHPSLV